MKINDLLNILNVYVGQYIYTEMYTKDFLLFCLNNALTSIYLYEGCLWEFSVFEYENISSGTAQKQYEMKNNIYNILFLRCVKNWEEVTAKYKKWGEKTYTENCLEYHYSWKTLYLSEPVKIKLVYEWAPEYYTLDDIHKDVPVPKDFYSVVVDLVLSEVYSLYFSEWAQLGAMFYNRAETKLKKLANKFWIKYANNYIKPK